MKKKTKKNEFLSKIEIAICVVMFFAMLISCGLYIDIKMNGKRSSLPPLSEIEKATLLKDDEMSSVINSDDLIEPVFVGIKYDSTHVAVLPNDKTRKSLEKSVYDAFYELFSGNCRRIIHETDEDYIEFMDSLKDIQRYMLISFAYDMPSAVFVPCLSNDYNVSIPDTELFNVKHVFILADIDDGVYAITVSDSGDVMYLEPKNKISFSRIFSRSYDINDGYTYFEFMDSTGIIPAYSVSFKARMYEILTLAESYGKQRDADWVNGIFELFGFNKSLVKAFASGDGDEMIYVDDTNELTIHDDGTVKLVLPRDGGIELRSFLEYYPENGRYSFSEKIFAIKNIVNELYSTDDVMSFTVSHISYNNDDESMKLYLKAMVGGAFLTERAVDAVFEIEGDRLTYAHFPMVLVTETYYSSLVIPQKQALNLYDGKENIFPILMYDNEKELYRVEWAAFSDSTAEVKE